ncbi:MAG: hypothetical protein ACYDB7_09460, partial [Mycobacteriales bacterium]
GATSPATSPGTSPGTGPTATSPGTGLTATSSPPSATASSATASSATAPSATAPSATAPPPAGAASPVALAGPGRRTGRTLPIALAALLAGLAAAAVGWRMHARRRARPG